MSEHRMSSLTYPGQLLKPPGFCERYWGGVFLVIAATVTTALYAYAVLLKVLSAHSLISSIILMAILLLLLFMLIWSYKVTHFTPAPTIPDRFKFTEVEWSFLESRSFMPEDVRHELCAWATARGIRTRGYNGQVNFCRACRILKPERAHHCRLCRKCIAKMDHHCPYFGNCIHYANFKFFLLTLFYAALGMLYIVVTTAICTVAVGAKEAFAVLNEDVIALVAYIVLLIVASMVVLSVGGFFVTSFHHALHNNTTLEHIGGKVVFASGSYESYDLGSGWENLKQQFGPSVLCWFLPIYTTPGDGVSFPVRSSTEELAEVRPIT